MAKYSPIDVHASRLEKFLAELPSDHGIEVRWTETAKTRTRNIVFWCEHEDKKRLLLLSFTPSSYCHVENVVHVEEVIDEGNSVSGVLATNSSVLADPREPHQESIYKLTGEEHLRLHQWIGLTLHRQ